MNKLRQNEVMQELSIEDKENVTGGAIGVVGGILLSAAIAMVVDQWPDIKQGAIDAWNSK
jgi:hypothetical protein